MKKLFKFIALAGLSFSALVGCSTDDEPSSNSSTDVTSSETSSSSSSSEGHSSSGSDSSITTTHTVTWKNYDGTVLETDTDVLYGSEPHYDGATPTKPKDAQYSYVFSSWTPALSRVSEDVIYTAQFSSVTNQFKVYFYDEDGTTILDQQTLDYGATPTYKGATPTKTGDAQYSYVFSSWTPELAPITEETSYTAQYQQVTNKYTVTFYNDDGTTVLDQQSLEYGSTPTYKGATPTKDPDGIYTYSFLEWDKEMSTVTSNQTYTATYSGTYIEYTVNFYGYNDVLISSDTYHYDDEIGVPVSPSRDYCTFDGWFVDKTSQFTPGAHVTGNMNIYAQFTPIEYPITYNLDGGTNSESNPESFNVDSEDIVLAPATKTGFTFGGWYLDSECEESSKVTTITSGSHEAVEVYAKWTLSEATANLKYSIGDNNRLTITGLYDTSVTDIVVPETIETSDKTYTVTAIEEGAFKDCSSLESITLPFAGGSSAAETANDTTLFGYVFGSDSYSGGTATTQHYGATGSATYYIPSSLREVTILGSKLLDGAFNSCSALTSITIAENVPLIDSGVFSGCSSLESITLPFVGATPNPEEASKSTLLGHCFGEVSYPGSTGTYEYYRNGGPSTTFYFPNSLRSVTVLGGKLLYGSMSRCSVITSFNIGAGVTTIGESAFYGSSSLTSVNIADGVTEICSNAFGQCPALTNISLPNTLKRFNTNFEPTVVEMYEDEYAYYLGNEDNHYVMLVDIKSKTISSFEFRSGTSAIYRNAFRNCVNLSEIVIPNQIISIPDYCFYGCSLLSSVILPDGFESFGNNSFYNCTSLTSISIPTGFVDAGNYPFQGCNALLNTYVSISSIEDWLNIKNRQYLTFAYHNIHLLDANNNNEEITELVIPNNITEIPEYAFTYCTSLESVIFEDSLVSIGNHAFSHCNGLNSVTIPSSVTNIGNFAFDSADLNDIYYIIPSVDAWLTGITGKNYLRAIKVHLIDLTSEEEIYSIDIPSTCTSIPDYAFYNCGNLTSIVISNNVTSIGESAFTNCTGLTSFVVTENVVSIGGHAFSYCNNLTSVVIPNSVETIGDGAFIQTKLVSIVLPENLNAISPYLFDTCWYLEEVIIPEHITSIGNNAFWQCTALVSVTIPDTVTSIGIYVFGNCRNLAYIHLPAGLTNIGNSVFQGCESLKAIDIPSTVTSIGNNAFSQCNVLATVYYGGTSAEWGTITINTGNDKLSTATVVYESCRNFRYINDGQYSYVIDDLNNVYELKCLDSSITSFDYHDNFSDKNIISLRRRAFYGFADLSTVILPDSVTTIGYEAFSSCTSLSTINMPSSLVVISEYAFQYCSQLSGDIILPNTVTSIKYGAFSGCSNIDSIYIPASVTTVATWAFTACNKATIYCQAESKPSGWANNWNPSNRPVVWGYTPA